MDDLRKMCIKTTGKTCLFILLCVGIHGRLAAEQAPVKLLSDNRGRQASTALRTGCTYFYCHARGDKPQMVYDPSDDRTGLIRRCLLDGEDQGPSHVARSYLQRTHVVFDLKNPYLVKRVAVKTGAEPRPVSVQLFAGTNERTVEKITDPVKPSAGQPDLIILDGLALTTRYLRIVATFPDGGGFLGEVEIWGCPASASEAK